jgi:hypothetical protein
MEKIAPGKLHRTLPIKPKKISKIKIDGIVKSPFGPIFVIPAKAGIHPAEGGTAFAGMTAFPTFYKVIKIDEFIRSLKIRFLSFRRTPDQVRGRRRNPVLSNSYKFSGLRFSPE